MMIPFGGNLVIVCQQSRDKPFSCLITDTLLDVNLVQSGQCFPMFVYEETIENEKQLSLFPEILDDYEKRL